MSKSGKGFGLLAHRGLPESISRLSYLTPPPDLSKVSDPNQVVAFKRLLKKDEATITKALEDILAHVKAHPEEQGGVEDGFVVAWVESYPRLTINNSRRVRELSHTIQKHITLSAGSKRFRPYLSQIFPVWYAGIFDKDKVVARAAQDGIGKWVTTEETAVKALRTYQREILSYAQDAFEETPTGLNDERGMSPDDLNASYNRLLCSSISMVAKLIDTLGEEDTQKHDSEYVALIGNSKLLKLTSGEDVSLRQETFQLIICATNKRPDWIRTNSKVICRALIQKALNIFQGPASILLLQALEKLTHNESSTWTVLSKSKDDDCLAALKNFIRRGSQRGPSTYWARLLSLLKNLPKDVFPNETTSAEEMLSSFRTGICHRDEPQVNKAAAWSSYFSLVQDVVHRLPDTDSRIRLLEEAVLPALRYYVLQDHGQTNWQSLSPQGVGESLNFCAFSGSEHDETRIRQAVDREILSCSQKLEDRLFDPVAMADDAFKAGQLAVAELFNHWFLCVKEVWTQGELRKYFEDDQQSNCLIEATKKITTACIKILTQRQGKPYGAACALLSSTNILLLAEWNDKGLADLVGGFLRNHLFELMGSPSSEYLVATLIAMGKCKDWNDKFDAIWNATIRKILGLTSSDVRQSKYIATFLQKTDSPVLATQHEALQEFIISRFDEALRNDDQVSWLVLDAALKSKSVNQNTGSHATTTVLELLESRDEDAVDRALTALAVLSKHGSIESCPDNDTRSSLFRAMLKIEQNSTEEHEERLAIIAKLRQDFVETNVQDTSPKKISSVQIIKKEFGAASKESLNCDVLCGLAESALAHLDDESPSDLVTELLITPSIWDEAFQPLYTQSPPIEAGVSEFFGSVGVWATRNSLPSIVTRWEFDTQGHSRPLRMALYALPLMQEHMLQLPSELAGEILFYLCLALQLLKSQRDSGQKNLMYSTTFTHFEDYESSLNDLLVILASNSRTWRRSTESDRRSSNDTTNLLDTLVSRLLSSTQKNNAFGYHSAMALRFLFSTIVAVNGPRFQCTDERLAEQKIFKRSEMFTTPLKALAIVTGFGQALEHSSVIQAYCNELVAALSAINDISEEASRPQTLLTLILFNGVLTVFDEDGLPPQPRRLQVLVSKLVSWFEAEDLRGFNCEIASESCRVLTKVLPSLASNPGDHWEQIIDRMCLRPWTVLMKPGRDHLDKVKLFVLSTNSLRLLLRLQRVKDGHCSETLTSRTSTDSGIYATLLTMLHREHTSNSPVQDAFDQDLSTAILQTPVKHKGRAVDEFWAPLGSSHVNIQAVAYTMLTRLLPDFVADMVVKENLGGSIDLPDELRSLILSDLLKPEQTEDLDLSTMQMEEAQKLRRSVLLAWAIVLRILELCPVEPRKKMVGHVKEMNELSHLLRFVEHTATDYAITNTEKRLKPLHRMGVYPDLLSKFDVQDLSHPDGISFQIRWLATHLYYQILQFAPALLKTWTHTLPQGRLKAIQAWTTKEFSSLVIQASMAEVRQWQLSEDNQDDDKFELRIPTKPTGVQITLSYEVDDTHCAVQFEYPPSFPLAQIKVTSLSRAAITEDQWTALLRFIEGAIRFSGGSVVDGIKMFRKNVSGILQGVEPCSICYSIVDETKRLPEKECGTCRNKFHPGCIGKWFRSSNGNTCPMCRQPFVTGAKLGRR